MKGCGSGRRNHKIQCAGKTYGRLYVFREVPIRKDGKICWLCLCSCGTLVIVTGKSLNGGHTRSCGCLQREKVGKLNFKHGHSKNERMYQIWCDIRKRCFNNNSWAYKYYGGRGISICERWSKYENFYKDLRESYYRHIELYGDVNTTIERVDNTKGYFPENCTWATRKEQSNNREFVRKITYNRQTHTVSKWAEILDMRPKTLYGRIFHYQWSIEDSFNKPVRQRRKNLCLTH